LMIIEGWKIQTVPNVSFQASREQAMAVSILQFSVSIFHHSFLSRV